MITGQSTDKPQPVLVGIDWGTTSMRIYLIDENGTVLDKSSNNFGIMQVKDGDFETVFENTIGRWALHAGVPVIASGMIASRNGWQEIDYAELPATLESIADGVKGVTNRLSVSLSFVPGVCKQADGEADVMRGEETQIFGADVANDEACLFVTPGTHSKWITYEHGSIRNIQTFMTGEVFSVMKEHSILGKLMVDSEFSSRGYVLGVEAGLNSERSLLQELFFVRTLPLFSKIEPFMVRDYLSGLLIGSEIASAVRRKGASGDIYVIGGGDVTARYREALAIAGLSSVALSEDIAAKGLYRCAAAAGIL